MSDRQPVTRKNKIITRPLKTERACAETHNLTLDDKRPRRNNVWQLYYTHPYWTNEGGVDTRIGGKNFKKGIKNGQKHG
jgi:hypothetical protein